MKENNKIKIEVNKISKEYLQEIVQGVSNDNIHAFLYNLAKCYLDFEYELSFLDLCLQHLNDQYAHFSEYLIDVLWTSFYETSGGCFDFNNNEKAQKLLKLCRHVQSLELLSEETWKLNIESEILEHLKLCENNKVYTKKCIRINTSLLYKQQKYNLLRESSEGYSKTITIITSIIEAKKENIKEIDEKILKVMGCFSLDRTIVVDLIVELFINNVLIMSSCCCECFVGFFLHSTLIKNKSLVDDLICFRFKESTTTRKNKPKELYVALAILINRKICNLDIVYAYLDPSPESYQASYQEYSEYLKAVARNSIPSIQTNNQQNLNQDEKQKDSLNNNTELMENNNNSRVEVQKAELLSALLSIGDVEHSMLILKDYSLFINMSSSGSADLCGLLAHVFDKFDSYQSIKPSSKRSKQTEANKTHLSKLYRDVSFYNEVCTYLFLLGPLLSSNAILFARICRYGVFVVKSNYKYKPMWMQIILKSLLPSTCLLEPNPELCDELWNLVNLYSLQERYQIYHHWRHSTYDETDELKAVRMKSTKAAMSLMRRITKDNYDEMSSRFSREIHTNPLVVFGVIINQVMGYHNMIDPVVDALQHSTPSELEILIFCCLDILCEANASKVKQDGINEADWIQGISRFMAKMCRRYTSIGIQPILNYIVNQLHRGSQYDLILLKDLMNIMAGIEGYESATLDQLEAISAGGTLKMESFVDISQTKFSQESAKRLIDCVIEYELLCVIPILIYFKKIKLQQQWEDLTKEKSPNERSLNQTAYWMDQCNETFMLFTEFVTDNTPPMILKDKLPCLSDLMKLQDTNSELLLLPNGISFYICRQKYRNHMQNTTKPRAHHVVSAIDVFNDKKKESHETKNKNLEGLNINDKQSFDSSSVWSSELLEVTEYFNSMQLFNDIRPQLFVTFWNYKPYDLYIPTNIYKKERTKLKEYISELESEAKRTNTKEGDSNNLSIKTTQLKKRIEALEIQQRKQMVQSFVVLKQLKEEKSHWFNAETSQSKLIETFINMCINPRIKISSIDAIYSARFVKTMHAIGTFNFSTLAFYDKIMDTIYETICNSTEGEVRYYGRFLGELLQTISAWHLDKKLYDNEAKGKGLPGFQRRWGQQAQDKHIRNQDLLNYEDFRHLVYKWHLKLHKAFVKALESRKLMITRNAIVLLTFLDGQFPRVKKIGTSIEKSMSKLISDAQFKDIEVLSISYQAILNKSKEKWILPENFHQEFTILDEESNSSSNKNNRNTTTEEDPNNVQQQSKKNHNNTEKLNNKSPLSPLHKSRKEESDSIEGNSNNGLKYSSAPTHSQRNHQHNSTPENISKHTRKRHHQSEENLTNKRQQMNKRLPQQYSKDYPPQHQRTDSNNTKHENNSISRHHSNSRLKKN